MPGSQPLIVGVVADRKFLDLYNAEINSFWPDSQVQCSSMIDQKLS